MYPPSLANLTDLNRLGLEYTALDGEIPYFTLDDNYSDDDPYVLATTTVQDYPATLKPKNSKTN